MKLLTCSQLPEYQLALWNEIVTRFPSASSFRHIVLWRYFVASYLSELIHIEEITSAPN